MVIWFTAIKNEYSVQLSEHRPPLIVQNSYTCFWKKKKHPKKQRQNRILLPWFSHVSQIGCVSPWILQFSKEDVNSNTHPVDFYVHIVLPLNTSMIYLYLGTFQEEKHKKILTLNIQQTINRKKEYS